jgi:hypothetical protein
VYAAAWFNGIDIFIQAQEYANTGGFLVFKGDGPKEDSCYPVRTMWTLSYHGNNHYNSIQSPGTHLVPLTTS